MWAFRSDLPLRKDTGRFVLWLVMVLVFVAALSVTVASYVGALLAHWDRSVTGTLTVQIPVDAKGSTTDGMTRALGILKTNPGVADATALPREDVLRLLEPWLGTGAGVADLPLPALIDVHLTSDGAAAAVTAAVTKAVPEAVVDDHRVWLGRLVGLAKAVGAMAVAIMLMMATALAFTIVFATRATLAEFRSVIQVLHLVGARDSYIARQFAARALRHGIMGGLVGLAIYVPAFGLIAGLMARVDQELLPRISLPLIHWAVLAALPLIAGVLAMVTAHLTVRRTLDAMM